MTSNRHLVETMDTVPAPDAVVAWRKMLRQAFMENDVRQIIVPLVAYSTVEVGYDGSKRAFRRPLVVRNGAVEDDEIIDHLNRELDGEGMDLALSGAVMLLDHERGITMHKFDIIDVAPGYAHHVADPISRRYDILRTQNSYHLYPKRSVFGTGDGEKIKDTKWTRGFLRVTQSAEKGRIWSHP